MNSRFDCGVYTHNMYNLHPSSSNGRYLLTAAVACEEYNRNEKQ